MRSGAIGFVSHPYHRGGVTKWMADSFISFYHEYGNGYFVSVNPKKPFASGQSRQLIADLIPRELSHAVFASGVDSFFEFGTIEYRANCYTKIILRSVPPDVPLIPSDDEACWMACAAVAQRNPMIAIVHSFGDQTYFNLLAKYQDFVSLVIPVSTAIEEKLVRDLRLRKKIRREVIPCGVIADKERIYNTNLQDQIIWVGRLEEESKRVSDIPKICIRLLSLRPGAILKVFGDGPMLQFLRDEKLTAKLSNLDIQGWRDPDVVRNEMARSKVVLLTSNYEGMPLCAMEGLINGCAVVSTLVSGIADVATDVRSKGIVSTFDVGDVDQAVSLLVKALSEHADIVSKKARELGLALFDIKKTNAKIIHAVNQADDGWLSTAELTINPLHILLSPFIALARMLKLKFTR